MAIYHAINANEVTFLYWLAVGCYALSIIATTIFGVKYLLYIRKLGIRNMDVTQLSSLIYLIMFSILGVYFNIFGIMHRGNFNQDFYVPFTCVEAAVSLHIMKN